MNAAIINDINYCKLTTALQFVQTNTAAGVPVALTANPTHFRKATVLGKKALDGTVNVGNVNIGPSATASQQPYVIAPGDEVELAAPLGAKWNFADWFLDTLNDGDGVVVIYS